MIPDERTIEALAPRHLLGPGRGRRERSICGIGSSAKNN